MTRQESISFNFEEVIIRGFNEKKLREWINTVVKEENNVIAEIQFIFCTDDRLLKINRQYLNHDTLTDIITFNYNDEFDGIAGDIFISYDRVKENASIYKVTIREELHRVIVHGVLHLLGYNDGTAQEERIIRAKENYYLTLLS